MAKSNPTGPDFWFDTATATNAAALTIFLRMMGFTAAARQGRLAHDPELTRMIDEKYRAAYKGSIAASKIWSDLFWSMAGGTVPTFCGVWDTASRATVSGTKPGYRKARANAKRLSRRKH